MTAPVRRDMKVLVTGGRSFADAGLLCQQMNSLRRLGISAVCAGGAKGADTLAAEWARGAGVPFTVFMADWVRDGVAAGPIRNKRMLTEFKPDLVVAFAGGVGTADMVHQAVFAGVSVLLVNGAGLLPASPRRSPPAGGFGLVGAATH